MIIVRIIFTLLLFFWITASKRENVREESRIFVSSDNIELENLE